MRIFRYTSYIAMNQNFIERMSKYDGTNLKVSCRDLKVRCGKTNNHLKQISIMEKQLGGYIKYESLVLAFYSMSNIITSTK